MLMYFERRQSNRQRFCKYSSEVHIRQRKTEMQTFVENCSEFSQRSFASSYLTFAAGEVKGRTASGPMIVLPRTITTEGYFINFESTTHWLKTRSWVWASTIGARRAKAARGSHRRKPPKPKGLALFQGRWRPTLGVIRVRARVRGPGHRDESRIRREHRRGTRHHGGAS